jgi:hypothetical protein
MTSLSKKGPIWKKKIKGIETALWRREHEGRNYYSISANRSYKVDNEWKTTSSFDLSEIDLVIDFLTQAKKLGEEYLAADREKRRQEDEAQAA